MLTKINKDAIIKSSKGDGKKDDLIKMFKNFFKIC